MDVCVLLCVCVVMCVGNDLSSGCSPIQGDLQIIYKSRNWKATKVQRWVVKQLITKQGESNLLVSADDNLATWVVKEDVRVTDILYRVPEMSGTLNSVALVRERTIPTEWRPPVDEVSANFCG
jgi:hypothetical protein